MALHEYVPVSGEASDFKAPELLLRDFHPHCDAVLPRTELAGFAHPPIDAHTHWGRLMMGESYADRYNTAEAVAKFRAAGIRKVVNIDADYGVYYDNMMRKLAGFEDFFYHVGGVDIGRFEEPGFEALVYQTMKAHKEHGLLGIKIWKNVGLGIRDKAGAYLRLDDERLACIWQAAAEFDLVVMAHVADPPAFFKPVDARNERFEELADHPEWIFNRPGMPSYTELIGMFEKVIAENPKTTFVGCHFICAEDLGKIAGWLRKYPNLHLDIADRIYEVGRAPYTARKFFTEFADRILFGSDMYAINQVDYPYYNRFLESWDEYLDYNDAASSKGRWKIYGIGLDDNVLRKLYYENARRILKIEL